MGVACCDREEVTAYGTAGLHRGPLLVDHERNVQRFGRPLLGVFTPTVIPSCRGDIGMTDKLLDHRDVDPGIETVRHARPT
jgi:hypothetical protein